MRTTYAANLIRLDHCNNILWTVRIKPLIMQFFFVLLLPVSQVHTVSSEHVPEHNLCSFLWVVYWAR
jgi:hypothetical protein